MQILWLMDLTNFLVFRNSLMKGKRNNRYTLKKSSWAQEDFYFDIFWYFSILSRVRIPNILTYVSYSRHNRSQNNRPLQKYYKLTKTRSLDFQNSYSGLKWEWIIYGSYSLSESWSIFCNRVWDRGQAREYLSNHGCCRCICKWRETCSNHTRGSQES